MVGGGAPVSGWQALDVQVAPGGMASAGALLIANVDGALLAYRNRCAGCGGALDHGDLRGGTLVCPACSLAFDLPHAGRSAEGLQLSPVPLLRDGDTVRVAVA
jgi:nitrite reductase/ring-hydroxylating ferredoxin subunit